MESPATSKPPSRMAFISGHIDLTEASFLTHYQAAIDKAIRENEHFILSNAGGADTLARQYLLAHGVHPSRITIWNHTPPERRKRDANATMRSIDESRTGEATLDSYRKQGLNVKVINGWHTERDAAMTAASDYDVLWVRPDEETKALYGEKYRPGRVSGTRKNKNRREEAANRG
ncbi:hypothetical protein Slin15195_G085800 [Septoria linicola]|uniref:Uncharacterized protein n=1 Tax=Septoria linicola TaxID=215465 RepID=A0A9Q9EKX8_9PEZI|nr:hypothetical protein Slin14017_G088390 [Septoria linicola]USW55261.1 hypothetical protein Slin15195_G085800 [Septoria linicola]